MVGTALQKLGISEIQDIPKIKLHREDSEVTIKIPVLNSQVAFNLFSNYLFSSNSELNKSVESFIIMLINDENHILGISEIGKGTKDRVKIDLRDVFSTALLTNSSSLIIGHNHPSKDVSPSEGDNHLTKEIDYGSRVLGLRLLDHIIFSPSDYYSYADKNLLSWQ